MRNPTIETDVETAKERYDAALVIKKLDGDTGVFEGHAAIFNVMDMDRDVILPGAFAASIKKKGAKGIRLLWQHNSREPIGVLEELREDDKGLYFRARLALGTQRGREARELLKMGAVDRMSIGFSLDPKAVETDNENGRRIIKEIDLWEISVVTFPAQPKARVSDVKAAERIKNARDFEEFLREAGFPRAFARSIASRGYVAACKFHSSDRRETDEVRAKCVAALRRAAQALTVG